MIKPRAGGRVERYLGYLQQLVNVVSGSPRPDSSLASIRRVQMLAAMFSAPVNYLEVGIWKGHTFSAVQFDRKYGVDPHPQYLARRRRGESIHRLASDDFFAREAGERTYQVIFLDGLHTFEQTARDLWNSMAVAQPNTVWLIDDIVPANEAQAADSIQQAFEISSAAGFPSYAWTGDVYLLAYALDDMRELLDYRTITGTDREQLLLWLRTDDMSSVANTGQEVCRAQAPLTFAEAFPDGPHRLPAVFRPASELEALSAAQGANDR